jgi:hypothetical protein
MTGPVVAMGRGTARWAQAAPVYERCAAELYRIGLDGHAAMAWREARMASGHVERGVEHANPREIRPDLPPVAAAWRKKMGTR